MTRRKRPDARGTSGNLRALALLTVGACSLERQGTLGPGFEVGGDTALASVASSGSAQATGVGGATTVSTTAVSASISASGTGGGTGGGGGGGGGSGGGSGGGATFDEVLETAFSPPLAFADDAYDGSQSSMHCVALVSSAGNGVTVASVELRLAFEHSQVGNLVVKVFAPSAFAVRVVSRPGHNEKMDDGSGDQTGHTANAEPAYPLTFRDGAMTSAEDLGKGLAATETVCKDGPKVCEYRPEPDKGAGFKFADFAGLEAAGTWKVCLADAVNGGLGSLHAVTLTLGLK